MPPSLRPNADLTLTAAALAAVLLLHAAALTLEPPTVPLSQVPEREGARVAVDARVLDVARGERATRLVLADGTHRLPAFAPARADVGPGDEVRAVGLASRFDEGPGLSIDALTIVLPALERPRSPRELAAEPEAFDGARVLVRGDVRGDELVGEGARLRWTGEAPPGKETSWLASGTFRYQERAVAYVLRVDAWTPPR